MRTGSYGGAVRDLLRSDLLRAMRARDRVAVAALRSALAALENAEAVPLPDTSPPSDGSPDDGGGPFAGSRLGAGAAEVDRRLLGAAEEEALVRAQVAERRDAAAELERLGRAERAERLRAEAAVLAASLDRSGPPRP